jgi:uncharacterized protein
MDKQKKSFGRIEWVDLTVPAADNIRDFYHQVVGWGHANVSMGDYNDYTMTIPDSGEPAAGVCHARGMNSGLPAQWLIYVTVPDLDKSIERCLTLGGRIVHGPINMGDTSRFCVIQDPAGAVMALFWHKTI